MEQHWIADRLEELGKRKAQLAEALGLPPTRISEILRGRREIQVAEVMPLARFLDMDPMTVLLLAAPLPDGGAPVAAVLSDDERAWLAAFRTLPADQRARWLKAPAAFSA